MCCFRFPTHPPMHTTMVIIPNSTHAAASTTDVVKIVVPEFDTFSDTLADGDKHEKY